MRRRIRGLLVSGKQLSLDSRMDLVNSLVRDARTAKEPPLDDDQLTDAPSDIEEGSEGTTPTPPPPGNGSFLLREP